MNNYEDSSSYRWDVWSSGGVYRVVGDSVVGGIGSAFDFDQSGEVVLVGSIALAMSVVGVTGASLSIGRPKIAAGLMVISAVVGVITVFTANIVGTVLLLIAAALAFFGGRRTSDRPGA
jgi:hypothetical protein